MSASKIKIIDLLGEVDEQHHLSAQVPANIRPGPVKLALVVPSDLGINEMEEESSSSWALGLSKEWVEELTDPREDIYTLTDGEPVDETR